MRIYKAILDNDFNVVSYEEPREEKETIFSYKRQETFEVDLSILKEYLELNGYVTTYMKKDSEEDFVMYVNPEHSFSTIWDNDTAIFVLNQIRQKQREEMWVVMEPGITADNFKAYIHTYPEIQGETNFIKGEKIHLKHPIAGGIWSSSNETLADIDRYTGLVKAKKLGRVTIRYIVDTGYGMATLFHKIQIT